MAIYRVIQHVSSWRRHLYCIRFRGFLGFHGAKLRCTQRVIAQVITPMRNVSSTNLRHSQWTARQWLSTRGLTSSVWSDDLLGGSTDASFVFGFGNDLGTSQVPTVVPSLERRLEHVLCPTAGWWTDESATLAQSAAVTGLNPKRYRM